MEKTLKEHLAEARAIRWAKTSEEARKEHSAKMNAKRWGKRNGLAVGEENPKEII